MKWMKVLWLVGLMGLFGCGEKADLETPVADLETEAATLSVADLKAKAQSYQEMIASKMAELEPIQAKLMELPMAEKMGTEAKALQEEIAAVNRDLAALKERLTVYMEALKKKGESLSESLN